MTSEGTTLFVIVAAAIKVIGATLVLVALLSAISYLLITIWRMHPMEVDGRDPETGGMRPFEIRNNDWVYLICRSCAFVQAGRWTGSPQQFIWTDGGACYRCGKELEWTTNADIDLRAKASKA